MGETTTIANLGNLATDIGTGLTWFWTIFSNLVQTIATNNILLWSCGLAIVAGTIFAGVKVVRKFGLKGRK